MKISLNGEWDLKWADGERGGLIHHRVPGLNSEHWLKAEVPGEIHLDLMRQGIIDDPACGQGILNARWVEEMFWSYRRDFVLPDSLDLAGNKVWLCFGGLDYSARIYLNGILAGAHENAFTPCRLPINDFVSHGKNTVTVSLESGLYHVSERSTRGYYGASDGESDVDELLHKRLWLRKPQSSFGWDWAPRLINVGITGDVYIEWQETVRDDALVLRTEVDGNETGRLKVRWYLEGISDECRPAPESFAFQFGVPLHLRSISTTTGAMQKGVFAELHVRVKEADVAFSCPVEIHKGVHFVEATIEIPDVRRWWCVGQGPQYLYAVNVSLHHAGTCVAERTQSVGFRTVVINQDVNPSGGRNFIIELNGRKVFAKGANLVPADIITARIDRKKSEMLVDRALEANFNMLRVWGGGLYESDDFYELCDRKGILVWQEFIFACGAYPANDAGFMENVREEATFQIRRLAYHPSLMAWCGNNEQEWHIWNTKKGVLHPDYALYHMILPRLLMMEDPDRYYQPSSPLTPLLGYPNADDAGDQHPWQVGFANEDYRDYRLMKCRFPNEGGVIGPTSLLSMKTSLAGGSKSPDSLNWQLHDNGIEQWYPYSIADHLLKAWTGKEIRSLSLEEYVYLGGMLQGEGLSEYITNFRRRKFDSAAAIFWMFNDCWPATRSWSIVDCFGNRNPSFHPVRRACMPVSVAVVYEKDADEVMIFGMNDTPDDHIVELRYGVMTFDGAWRDERIQNVKIKANASIIVASFPFEKWEVMDTKRSFAYAVITQTGTLVARHRLILPMYQEIILGKPSISVHRESNRWIFRSDIFAMNVCIDLCGEQQLQDNFFDLFPGEEYAVRAESEDTGDMLYSLGSFLYER